MSPPATEAEVPIEATTDAPPGVSVGVDEQPFPACHRAYDFASYLESRDALSRAVTVTIGNRDLAVEAVDEAMARAYQRWSRVSRLDNPGGWVYRVAVNWATSVLRRRRRAVASGTDFSARPVDFTVQAPIAAEPDVLRAIAELDIRQRAVVVCRYLLGYSEAETAEALSTPTGTVKSRLFRANRQLAVRLSHLREDQP